MNPMPKPTTPNTPLTRRALLHTGAGICATAAGAVLLSACSSSDDSLAKQANSGDNKGYIAGDGSVTEYQKPNAVTLSPSPANSSTEKP